MRAKSPKPQPVSELTMNLFAPGMSILHRAGLGGLACTLNAMESHFKRGLLKTGQLPAEFVNGQPPWEIAEQSVTLRFGQPENARDYLRKLFAFAFAIQADGLIYLPGAYEPDQSPLAAVLADLQTGVTLTFLQHGKVRQLAKELTVVSYDPEGKGMPGVVVEYRRCSGYKHRDGWEGFVDRNGCLVQTPIKIDGPISPGTVVRHVAYTSDTAAEDPPERMLPLYFALVGCLSLPVNRGVAALIIPDVVNLLEFIFDRPAMTPSTATECQIGNAADAALQAQIRLRSRRAMSGSAIPGCYAMTFRPTAWASQQKSRVATIYVPPDQDKVLDRFDKALALLPTRIVPRTIKETIGRGKQRRTTERLESFRADSVVRPLVAENLALGRPWYAGFANLMTRINPATDRPYRDQLGFERKGLHDMISSSDMWDDDGEALVVKAVHEAMRMRYGQIASENKGKPVAMMNRMQSFREKLRLDLAGAKTEAHVRFALMNLFSRGGNNSVLREGWQRVLPVIRRDWHLARDLGLLALASYAGKEATDSDESTSK